MKKKSSVNYFYFGFIFLVLSCLHVYHVLLLEKGSLYDRFFYGVYALGQSLLEVSILAVIDHYIRNWHRAFKSVFVVLTFLLLTVHIIDFPLLRIMGMTVWYGLDFVRELSFDSFVEMLKASNVAISSWIIGGVVALVIPVLGVLFYRFTERLTQRMQRNLSPVFVKAGLFSAALLLLVFDFTSDRMMKPREERDFANTLPWKSTFFASGRPALKVGHKMVAKPSERQFLRKLEANDLNAAKKPNIFLFIVESIRGDYITPEIAPTLSQFKRDNISFTHSLAAANGTTLSWFSIFHSVYPFYWDARTPKKWQSGSLPLQILKKAGYQIRLYSSSRLQYYQMNERIFGKNDQLADSIKLFGEEGGKENHLLDAACIQAVIDDLETYKKGNVFIIFLESTHFGYSWPEHKTLSLKPMPSAVDFLGITYSYDPVEGIKNRYKNAIHYIDTLFASFFDKLSEQSGGKEAVVVVTGDHGEEFFEEGRIFHASHLSPMQTEVPIYYKLGLRTASRLEDQKLTSHLDIFPTILHHVLGKDTFESWFDGESILRPRVKNFAISTRFNTTRAPYEFLIHTGKKQLVAQLGNRSNVLKSNSLEILAHRDENGESLELEMDQVQSDFKEAFESLFNHK